MMPEECLILTNSMGPRVTTALLPPDIGVPGSGCVSHGYCP